jgi:hypothetical protein
MQTIAHQFEGSPILGAQEKRIEWFEEAYEAAMSKGEAISDTRRQERSKDSTVLTPTGSGP